MKDYAINDSSFDNGLLFQKGTESSSLLVIAFTGGAKILMIDPDEFMSETGLIKHHRISLWDRYRLYYRNGVNDQITDFHQLCGYFKDKIRELSIRKVLVIGTSSGGHPAFLAAHYLNADYAHAFGPQTSIGMDSLREESIIPFNKRLKVVKALYQTHSRNWKSFDLRAALQKHNGKTRYFIHYAGGNQYDAARSRRMENVAGVKLFSYPYKNHAIISPMVKNGYLSKLFRNKYVDNPQELFELNYGDTIETPKPIAPKPASHAEIAQTIQRIAVSRPDLEFIKNSQDLVNELALDSVALLELVVELENIFSIHIAIDALAGKDLKTVENIVDLVKRSKESG